MRIQIQKVVSPESEFLKDIPQVFENDMTIEYRPESQNVSCPSSCDGVTEQEYVDGIQERLN